MTVFKGESTSTQIPGARVTQFKERTSARRNAPAGSLTAPWNLLTWGHLRPWNNVEGFCPILLRVAAEFPLGHGARDDREQVRASLNPWPGHTTLWTHALPLFRYDANPMSFGGITFVGADESVDPTALSTITSFYFPVEWALRLCTERQGQAEGYPSLAWMEELPPEIRLAGHLGGGLCEEFLQGNDRELVEAYGSIWSRLDRIQLDAGSLPCSWEAKPFVALVRKHAGKTFIVPVREDNQRMAEALLKELGAPGEGTRSGRPASPRVAVLFDLSAPPAEWPLGRKAYAACGYAGGLTPENVREHVPRIHRRALRAQSWWMHLDQGLRGNAVFGSGAFRAGGMQPAVEPSAAARKTRTRFELTRCRQALDEIGRYFLDYSI